MTMLCLAQDYVLQCRLILQCRSHQWHKGGKLCDHPLRLRYSSCTIWCTQWKSPEASMILRTPQPRHLQLSNQLLHQGSM